MVAAVVYGVLYIYQLFTNTEVYNCHNVLYHKDTKISVYFFPLQKKWSEIILLIPNFVSSSAWR